MESDAGLGSDLPPIGATASLPGVEAIEAMPPGQTIGEAFPSGSVAVAPLAQAPARPPGVAETIGGALDLALAASRGVRQASLYIGVVTLLIVGPAVVLVLAIIRDQGGFEDAMLLLLGEQTYFDPPEAGAISMLRFTTIVAVIGATLISLEGQIMAATMIGGAATGRKIGIRDALRLSRRVFWSVFGAAVLVGILDQIVVNVMNGVAYGVTRSVDGASIIAILASALIVMPFAFYLSGIILGGVGAIEALRRSTRVAKARWRLALLVALAGAVVSFIEVFALGAGLDIVIRLAAAAGLGLDGSAPTALVTVALVLVCIVAIGSLLVTISALIAAPQVVVFLRMTGYSAGLDRARVTAAGSERPTRLVTRPMLALIILGVVAGLAGLASL